MNPDFLSCPVKGCNRKYKTQAKLTLHLKSNHPDDDGGDAEKGWVVLEDIPLPRERMSPNTFERLTGITAFENLVAAPTLTNKQRKDAERQQIQDREAQLHHAKLQAEQSRIEREKLERERIEQQIEAQKKLEARMLEHPEQCAICYERSSGGAAVIPCGHACFCFECLTDYVKKQKSRGCPVCRGQILTIQRIFI
jgi:hypothetical protein